MEYYAAHGDDSEDSDDNDDGYPAHRVVRLCSLKVAKELSIDTVAELLLGAVKVGAGNRAAVQAAVLQSGLLGGITRPRRQGQWACALQAV